ncbi:matrix metalloproteinase-24-like isoform X2 [Amphibalanus amphitrite]|uniref:matrix metalloproteinase-24-like isoform X2 n=1 Tax=Amphibalanus amphitrite TaxID=1232801 RepID=UPI001C8FCDDD|nr:matrix metalloproteinase-24-like isoform X2 [Amphibalanus amphitrite]
MTTGGPAAAGHSRSPAVGGGAPRTAPVPTMAASLQLGVVIAVVLVIHTTGANPTLKDSPPESIIEAATYLARYGYSSSSPTEDKSGALVSLSSNLEEFQRFAGLKVTGVLDEATIEKMREPRCGVKDKLGPSYRARRRKRYALQGSRWRTKTLRYKIMSWPSNLLDNKDGVRDVILESFKAWSDVSGLSFEEVGSGSKSNIEIRFASGDHGDGDAFDGPGGTLAHAFFPIYGGDAHFDDSENWKVDPRKRGGIDMFTVAAHEFGHSLGLSHSDVNEALMAPFYKPPSLDRDVIKEDDIKAIQELYGPPAADAAPAPDPREPSSPGDREDPDPILCQDSAVDAMLTIDVNGQKRTYVFKGDHYWRLTSSGVEKGYPRLIREMWGGVPDNLDAILPYEEADRVYFFKGSQYWRMTGLKLDSGYPKPISAGFPGIPDNLDAAFKWRANGKMYFFKGSQYWRFDSELETTGRPGVSDKYPQPISIWQGIPNNIDSVLIYENKRTYFFKGDSYYRFNDAAFSVDASYPRSTAEYWFGCTGQISNLVTPSSDNPSDYSGNDEGPWKSSTIFSS